MKRVTYICLIAVLTLLSSCVSQKNVVQYTQPDQVRLEIGMSDLQYLGTVDVEICYKTYGVIKKIVSVNGQAYNPRYFSETSLSMDLPYRSQLDKALYLVNDTYPTASYVIPANYKKTVEYMLGGRIITEKMTVKVYAIK